MHALWVLNAIRGVLDAALVYVQGTIRDICDVLAVDSSLEHQLDWRPLRGSRSVPRWHKQVSHILESAEWARLTGEKRGMCHVYRAVPPVTVT